jgi:hypothetical protein
MFFHNKLSNNGATVCALAQDSSQEQDFPESNFLQRPGGASIQIAIFAEVAPE